MSVTVIDDEKKDDVSDASIVKDVGRIEAEIEHLEEKNEETEEKIETVEEKLETVEERLEWNSQEKTQIWNRLEQQESKISEVTAIASEILEMLKAEEVETPSSEDEEDLVIVDVQPIEETTQEEPIATKPKGNLLTKFFFGRQG